MKKFRCLRSFALLLSMLMLIYAFPFSTNAITNTDAPDIAAEPATDIGAPFTDIIGTEDIDGIREVTDLREESVKHFALPDGTYTAVTYPSPVHRKDESGTWQDIDNSLSMKAVKGVERYVTDDLRVSFAKTYAAGEALFALTENGYTIQMVPHLTASDPGVSVMALAPTENKVATVMNAEKRPVTERFDTIEEAAEIDNKSVIVYENVKANTDLEYVLDGNDVKENIIVKRAGGSYVYRFTLSLAGLTATLLPTGNVSLTDSETGAEKYIIPAPYMYDADGVLSYDVHYTLTSAGSGNYTLTVTASDEWINAEDRAFPVTIDPTVTNPHQIYDTYVYSKAPSTNYNSNTLLPINDDTFVYSMWLIPYLPTGAIITNASMYLMPLNIESDTIGVSIYKMQESWSSPSITWNSAQTDMSNFGMAYTPYDTVALSTDAVYKKVNITSLAQEWYANRSSNFGIALWKTVGTNNDVLIYSSEADSGKNMYYTVTYRLFEDGVYFIQNVATGRYMDVEGPSRNEGAIIQQWNFHGADQSRWRLTHDTNGNIKIQSVYSSRYITTNSASSSVTQTSTLNDYSTWAFQQTDSGNYKIVCTGITSSANTLSVPSATSGNGADLVMTSYTDNSDYRDEWKLYRINCVVNLDVLYDHAYNNRYSSSANRIQNGLLVLQEKYLTEFGVLINTTTPTLFSSYGDSACSSTPTSSCTHSNNEQCYNSTFSTLQSYHHKNLYNMILRIPFPDLTSTLRITFLGHDYCIAERDDDGNLIQHRTDKPKLGLAYTDLGFAVITNFGDSNDETRTLIHEFGHFYGAPDHYAIGGAKSTQEMIADTGIAGFSEDCIYGENKSADNVLSDYIICDGCKSYIAANAWRYNHN